MVDICIYIVTCVYVDMKIDFVLPRVSIDIDIDIVIIL